MRTCVLVLDNFLQFASLKQSPLPVLSMPPEQRTTCVKFLHRFVKRHRRNKHPPLVTYAVSRRDCTKFSRQAISLPLELLG